MRIDPKRNSLSCSSSCFHNHEQELQTNSLSRSLGVIDIEETARDMHHTHRHRRKDKHASSSDLNSQILNGSSLLPPNDDIDYEVKIIRRRRRKTHSTQIETPPNSDNNSNHAYNTLPKKTPIHSSSSSSSSSPPSHSPSNLLTNNTPSSPSPLNIPRSTSLPPCYHSSLHNSLPYSSSSPLPSPLNPIEDQFVALCVCQQSSLYPFCDDTHKIFNEETNSSISPIYAKFTITDQSTPLAPAPSQAQTQTIHTTPTPAIINHNNTIPHPLVCNQNTEPQQTTTPTLPPQNTEATFPTQIPPKATRVYITPGPFKNPELQKNIFEWEQISLHNTLDDCWMVFNGNVYDVSKYVNFHPGGKRALQKFAGKDGSENIEFHSAEMLNTLNSTYFIGKLKQEEKPSRCIIS